MDISKKQKGELLKTAREVIVASLEGRSPRLPPAEGLYTRPCGAFVTLHKGGRLRGCIGHIVARRPLLETIEEMARAAAFQDPRFPPVTPEEMAAIDLEISVLSPLETLENPGDLIPGTHGLYLSRGTRTGVLLPQVATQEGWDRETFLTHTCFKAGLPGDAWRDSSTHLQVFTAQVFGEKDAPK